MLKYQGSWRRTQIMKNSSNRNSNDERESEKLRCRNRRSLNDGQESQRVDDGLREFERRVCIRASQMLRFDKMVTRGHPRGAEMAVTGVEARSEGYRATHWVT